MVNKNLLVLDLADGLQKLANISSFEEVTSVADADLMLIEQGTAQAIRKVSIEDLKAEFGGGGASFESREITTNITLNKSTNWANYVRINNTSGSLKTITFGTDYVAGDYYFFSFDFETSQIAFSIQSQLFSFWGGGILFIFFDGTNWNNILPNQNQYNNGTYDRGLNFGFGNRTGTTSIAFGRAVTSRGNVSVGFGDNIDIGEGVSAVGLGSGITSTGNFNSLFGNNITNTGINNRIVGQFINGSGNRNTIISDDGANPNNKSYLKGMGNGVRFLHSGEITYKIDNNNYADSGYTAHLRVVNLGGTSINNAITEIYLNDSTSADRLVIPQNTTYFIKGRIVAMKTDQSEIKQWEVSLTIQTNSSNTTQILGTETSTLLQETTNAVDYNYTFSADNTNKALKLEVQGRTMETIFFKAVLEVIDIRQ